MNGADVPVTDGKLKIEVADPDMSEYATNTSVDGKLESYAKSDDVDTKINSIPKGISLWKGSADDYAAIESKDDSTEYNVVDDTGIKNIYVGSSEIYKRGIPEGTVLWNSDLIFDPKTNSFNKSVQYNSVKYSVLGADFDYSLVKNGFMIGINDCIPTDNTQYPFLGYSNSNLPRDSHKREKDADGNFTNSINYIFVPINKLKPVGFDIKSLYVLWTKDTTTSETVDNPWCYKKDMIGSLRRAAWTTNITNTSLYLNINDQNNFSLAFRGASQFTPRDTSLKISIIYPLIQQVIAM